MVFELLIWIYITFICFAWGVFVAKIINPGLADFPEFSFPIICLFGLFVIGIIAWYFSIFLPISVEFRILLTSPALLYYLWRSNRLLLAGFLGGIFNKMKPVDLFLLMVCVVMLIFLTNSPVIHPDSLNYHGYSIRFLQHFGIIPGIANLKLEFGFQSLWFVVLGIFDFSFLQPHLAFPLNGCFLFWFLIFLVSKLAEHRAATNNNAASQQEFWYFILLVFTIISWTQFRLTASSASPDFIATISVLLSFYFLNRRLPESGGNFSIYFAVFFALMAVCIKVSVITILCLPFFVFVYGLFNRNLRMTWSCILLSAISLTPLMVRNVISTGYPLYPSSFAGPFPVDWKINLLTLTRFQHYITGYARYPIIIENANAEFGLAFTKWFPRWWEHLLLADKFMLVMIALGAGLNLFYFKKWKTQLLGNRGVAFFFSLAGVVVWFIHAPDPRFGTGFLLPLLYFQFAPFWNDREVFLRNYYGRHLSIAKWIASFFILFYIGYRSIHFFNASQLIYPEGISGTVHIESGCDERIKAMMIRDIQVPLQFPDSCRTFSFRGKFLKDGFKPKN
jgi:hypothetical protein